jgi:hypothetical protein
MSFLFAALVDTAITEDPRLVLLPRGVRYAHIEAIVWCRLHLTDGAIPRHMLRRLSDEPDTDEAARQLVDSGLWETTKTGWQIVGFTDTQMSAERVRGRQAKASERYERYVGGKRNDVSNDVGNDVSNVSDLTRPDLTRRGRDGGRSQGGGSGRSRPAADARAPEDGFECSRCRHWFSLPELTYLSDGGYTEQSGEFCELCAVAVDRRADKIRMGREKPTCLAYKKDGDACSVLVKDSEVNATPLYCVFHGEARKRGTGPEPMELRKCEDCGFTTRDVHKLSWHFDVHECEWSDCDETKQEGERYCTEHVMDEAARLAAEDDDEEDGETPKFEFKTYTAAEIMAMDPNPTRANQGSDQ